MISECVRCGHEINTDTEAGAEQGIVRAWMGDGYADFHVLCRQLDLQDKARDRAGEPKPAPKRRGRPPKAMKNPEPQPVPDDEMADG
jgi:hypothetical protein